MYIKYLQRIREKVIGQANVGRLVERITNKGAWAYSKRPRSTEDYLRVKNASHLPGFHLDGDLIQQEYFKNSKAAMEAYFFTLHDYLDFIQLPSTMRGPSTSVKDYIAHNLVAVKDSINNKLSKFDYGTTYPDAVMCISMLQALKYLSLITSNVKFFNRASQRLQAAMAALDNMDYSPVRFWSINNTEVYLMPHEPNGRPNIIPITVYKGQGKSVIRISSLDVKNPDDIQEVIALLRKVKI